MIKQPHKCHPILSQMLLNSDWCNEISGTFFQQPHPNKDIAHVKTVVTLKIVCSCRIPVAHSETLIKKIGFQGL